MSSLTQLGDQNHTVPLAFLDICINKVKVVCVLKYHTMIVYGQMGVKIPVL